MGMKAMIFSIDLLFALFILFGSIHYLSYVQTTSESSSNEILTSQSRDVINVFSKLSMRDALVFPEARQMYTSGLIADADLDLSLLEALGAYYLSNNSERAVNLSRIVLNSIVSNDVGFSFSIDDSMVFNNSVPLTSLKVVSKALRSGYEVGKPVSGYLSRAYLSNVRGNLSEIIYFGGYEGDGNITKNFTLPENLDSVYAVYLEMDYNAPFDLYVNGNYSGAFVNSTPEIVPDRWNISSSYLGNFKQGENVLLFTFSSGYGGIGGGFMRIYYNSSDVNLSADTDRNTLRLPGINGVVNLFSSIDVPGSLNSIELYLHYISNFTTFVTVGNTTISNSPNKTEQKLVFSNATLSSILDYNALSNKTTPIRIGSKNISFIKGYGGKSDSVLVTDISGSMDWCPACEYGCCNGTFCDYNICEASTCENLECGACPLNASICTYECCALSWFGTCITGWTNKSCISSSCSGNQCGAICSLTRNHNTKYKDLYPSGYNITTMTSGCAVTKLDMARPAGKEFVSIVLNVSGNRVGLVNYSSSTRGTTPLGNNSEMLKSVIDSYTASGGTCICCGVNSASSMINSQSNTSRRKSMLVMSDGQATEECSQQGTTGDLNGDGHADWPEDDAIQSACDAKNNRNITVYTVGFGTDVDTNTLQLMADCGGGRFFNATNMTELLDVYKVIASEISNMSYDVQTIEVLSENSPNMVLFPDSYIKIDYIPQNPSYTYGEISQNFETPMFGGSVESPKTGNFTVPNGTSVLSSKLISYSGRYWTSMVNINGNPVYNLSAYNTEFYDLGDPYSVIMPASLVNAGNENTVSVDTGSGENNMTGGSPDSKVIYTASIKSSVGYAGVFYDEDEAKEDAKERLQGLIANYSVTGDITVDSTNAAGIRYLWGPTEFKIAVWR